MVMFNHSSQKQTLDYLCIQPEEIKNAYMQLNLWVWPIDGQEAPFVGAYSNIDYLRFGNVKFNDKSLT